jgi:hypothetical protein
MNQITSIILCVSIICSPAIALINPDTSPLASISGIEIEANYYGMHGRTPVLKVSLENKYAQPLQDVSFSLFENSRQIYSDIPLAAIDVGSREFWIPWAAEAGKWDRRIRVEISAHNPENSLFSATKTVLFPEQEIRYSDVLTHPWITRRAVELLLLEYPDGEYAEVGQFIDALASGSTHEDELGADNDANSSSERFYRHFYRPTDGLGLQEVPGYPPNITDCVSNLEDSFSWGSGEVAYNEFDWLDALTHYENGDLWEAYFALGHVVHLLEDASVPAHTHLDIHAVSLTEDIGDDYEDYCEDLLNSGGILPLPAANEGLIEFDNLFAYWSNPGAEFPENGMSRLSYTRNRFPCDLSNEGQAVGILKQMYPSLDYGWDFWAFEYQWDIDSPDLGNWDYDFGSSCPGDFYAGSMGDDEWWVCSANYANPDPGDIYYVENTEYVAQLYKDSWDPENHSNDTYLSNTAGLSQVEYLAEDLIPLAIRYSAGLMKFFYDSANPAPADPPQLSIQTDGLSIILNWVEDSTVSSYRVYSSTDPAENFMLDENGIFDQNQWTRSINSAMMYYQVRAIR